jgi:hypothetical protein
MIADHFLTASIIEFDAHFANPGLVREIATNDCRAR